MQIRFTESEYLVSEESTSVQVCVEITPPMAEAIVVVINVMDGTATGQLLELRAFRK